MHCGITQCTSPLEADTKAEGAPPQLEPKAAPHVHVYATVPGGIDGGEGEVGGGEGGAGGEGDTNDLQMQS